MTLKQNRLTESLYDQLKYIHPFEDDQKIKERYDFVIQNKDEERVETSFKNVKEFESLNFPSYRHLDSSFQKIIRNNSADGSRINVLDFFKILSEQINDINLNKILSIEVITYLFEKTDINKQVLNSKGLQTLKKLANKFPGYSPNQSIQFHLLIPSDNDNDQVFSKISYDSNIEYLLSFELDSSKLPQNFFNSNLITDLIIHDHSHVKKVSSKCLKIMGEIYEILGEAYLNEINSKEFQTKIIVSQVEDKSTHDQNVQKFVSFLNVLMTELRRLGGVSEPESLYVNKQVLEFLINDFEFNYTENLAFLYFMKQNMTEIKYNTKIIWSILKPEIFASSSEEHEILIQNLKNLKKYIESAKTKDTLKLINTDFVLGLIETKSLVTIEHLNNLIKLNRTLVSKKSQLADLKTIKFFFKSRINETNLIIDEILQNLLSKSSRDLSTVETSDTDKISFDIDSKKNELDENNKALSNKNEFTIMVDSREEEKQHDKKKIKINISNTEHSIKIFELILIILSLFYLLYYLINQMF